jgi:hypothetical protein
MNSFTFEMANPTRAAFMCSRVSVAFRFCSRSAGEVEDDDVLAPLPLPELLSP